MRTFAVKHPDAEARPLQFRLRPLSDYIEIGGRFNDLEQGGQDRRAAAIAGQFLAAIEVEPATLGGLEPSEALDEIGARGRWQDTTTGWILLQSWPPATPIGVVIDGFPPLTLAQRVLLVEPVSLERELDPDWFSVPLEQHVVAFLAGDYGWKREAADYFRSAYIGNVYRVAEAAQALKPTPQQVRAVIRTLLEAATVAD